MMFLKSKPPAALAGLEQSDDLKAGRHQEAEQDYLTGLAKLKQAESQGYQDKSGVLAAYRHFATAIQKNRGEARYQTAMAYLLILIGSCQRATIYLAAALRLDPGNQRALMLQEQIRQIQSASPNRLRQAAWQALENGPRPQSDEDYDQSYEELEAFITRELRLMMQTSVSPEPTLDLELAQDQARFHEQLLALDRLLSEKIALLETEIETQPLVRMLAPLHQLANRMEQALELHTLFHLLLDGIEGAIDEAIGLQALLDTEGKLHQAELDALLDLCDELADQLDELDRYTGVKPVEKRYEALAREIEKLQERMEGA